MGGVRWRTGAIALAIAAVAACGSSGDPVEVAVEDKLPYAETASSTTSMPQRETTTTVAPTTTLPPTTTTAAPQPTAPPAPQPFVGSASYANCDEVRAAGKAPIYRGDPGFEQKFDRDNDGVGCE